MPDDKPSSPQRDVAVWHTLSGAPAGVTDQGVLVDADPGHKLQAEKRALRAAARRLSHGSQAPYEARTLARLASSYLLAGDTETARRYLDQAQRIVEKVDKEQPAGSGG